ncbi:MAG: class I SAM-dependent methyltransferase [Solidesulfovibrio sp.]|uniref:class I SAM-dependent DNA methyltransferase n=1 Tax=Solidesulfovibrio sp. TaxID=2910990 RepID=UPI002B1FEF44|nr:class I SAM-dependent methyltransferase [Solidesulfovibrio sp.]MEA4854838.1 class I SAM-dependent methyltransferase [Solidesulfovibrio sp.]
MRNDAIVNGYERIADWFLARRRADEPLLEREYLETVLAGLPAAGVVLDLGCGGGEPMAGYFLRHGRRVVGLDGSLGMLAACRRRLPGMALVAADMRALPLRGRFAAVVAWDSFFHLPYEDQRGMFPAFGELVAPGGLLLFTSGPAHGRSDGVMDGVTFAHYSLSAGEYRERLGRCGFEVLVHRVEDPDCGGHTVWLARKAAAG